MKFKQLAITNSDDLIFGLAPNPVTTSRGLIIGGGIVYPELNFTLPSMEVSLKNLDNVLKQYHEIVTGALERALQLESRGVILELETLLEMTQEPDIGVSILQMMNDLCEDYYARYGLASEIRLTPNDLREFERPPKSRTSAHLDKMLELFERGAEAGGDFLSIETTGGKEISDDALMMCNMQQFVFSQAVLGVRDMQMMWSKIVAIAAKYNRTPGGDTACGFANTAMVLAEKNYIPRVFAAVCRVVTVVRSLIAVEQGAKGPDKDCGYEGPFLKAIAGIPISMEGKTSACAHFSPVGNVAGACADLWSNESVQNIKLLAGMAPTVYLEQLEYDTRLMNTARSKGKETALIYRDLMVESDIFHDPQALVLSPQAVIQISKVIVAADNYLIATRDAGLAAIAIIEQNYSEGKLKLSEMEAPYLDIIKADLQAIPDEEEEFIAMVEPTLEAGKFLPAEYGI
jgi:methanol---5-hydroxybenzimidazolylcobamide Co-methyltransferase